MDLQIETGRELLEVRILTLCDILDDPNSNQRHHDIWDFWEFLTSQTATEATIHQILLVVHTAVRF